MQITQVQGWQPGGRINKGMALLQQGCQGARVPGLDRLPKGHPVAQPSQRLQPKLCGHRAAPAKLYPRHRAARSL